MSFPPQMQKLVLLCVVGVVAAQSSETRFFSGGLNGGYGGVYGGGFGGNFGGGYTGGYSGGYGGGFGGAYGGGYGGGYHHGSGANCRYYCRGVIPGSLTPRYYCCEDNTHRPSPPIVKPGFCPTVRPVCPGIKTFSRPQPCSSDGSCFGSDKCCYDRCLNESVCKPAQGYGRR